jgi:hypothetical protein
MTGYRFGPSIDCADAGALAAFWAALLDGEVTLTGEGYAVVAVAQGWLTAYEVDDYQPPTWPDGARPRQLHLDVAVADLEDAERRALALGATKPSTQPSPTEWRVLLDPAGHPFCLTTAGPP